ncbi:MAG: PQQ-binding-like beta-propeller repeat protein [Verrucomicrobiales bacterium]
MALAGDNVIVAGPPDTLDEEYAFERLTQKDPAIREELVKQAEALDGKSGAKLWSVNVKSGEQSGGFDLESPPVWDGMAVARGRLYVSSVDGKVLCFGKP